MRLGSLIGLQTGITVLAGIAFGASVFRCHSEALETAHKNERLGIDREKCERIGDVISQLALLGDLTLAGNTTYLTKAVNTNADFAIQAVRYGVSPDFLAVCNIQPDRLVGQIEEMRSLTLEGAFYEGQDRDQRLYQLLDSFDQVVLEASDTLQQAEGPAARALKESALRARQAAESAWMTTLLGAAFFGMVILGMWRLLNRTIEGPIVRLTKATTDAIESGFFRSPHDGPAEVATLSKRFDGLVADMNHALASRTAFLANTSHELRTPLTAILGYADYLSNGEFSDEELAEGLSSIQRSGSHLLGLISEVLDLSKIDADQMTLDLAATDIRALMQDIDAILSKNAERAGVELDLELQEQLPPALMLDPMRLRQIILNVAGNAIKFSADGSVRIVVEYVDSRLFATIVDTGIGIAEDRLDAVFEDFEQADSSSTRLYGGTGLGLAISRRLARLMDGDLTVTSQLGEGSQFHLVIDAPLALDGVSSPIVEGPNKSTDGTQAAGAKILLVDDVALNRRLGMRILERAGYEVDLAEDGAEAIAAVAAARDERAPHDLILMDMQMPVMSGIEATKAILAGGYGGSVIALTAITLAEERKEAMEAGCSAFISKPFSVSALLEAIQRELNTCQASE